jgi:CRP/FNR family transcriptional regulator
MNNSDMCRELSLAMPGLDDAARHILARHGRPAELPRGAVIFRPGEACHQLVLLAQGAVQVRTISENGREIELYRVEPGETCVLSVACLLGDRLYEAEGVAESDLAGVAISRAVFHELLDSSAAFRKMVLDVQTRRIYDLIALVDTVAFQRTEERLAIHLLHRRDGAGDVAGTHQAIADEIGTVREVVSRRLKRFEAAGLVALERGRVRVLDPEGLRHVASESAR